MILGDICIFSFFLSGANLPPRQRAQSRPMYHCQSTLVCSCKRSSVFCIFVFVVACSSVSITLSSLVWNGVMMFCKVIIYIENGKVCDLYSGVHMAA